MRSPRVLCPAVRVSHSTGRGFPTTCARVSTGRSCCRAGSIRPTSSERYARRNRGASTSHRASKSAMPKADRGADSRMRHASPRSCKECAMQMTDLPGLYNLPDERGHFGAYGGVFVAETLIRALDELKTQYARYRDDAEFRAEFERELKHYVGRPSPVYHAARW